MELCEENSSLAKMKKKLGCLPIEFVGQHSHHCEGSPLNPNETKNFRIFVEKIENFCAAKPCTKVGKIRNTIAIHYNVMLRTVLNTSTRV